MGNIERMSIAQETYSQLHPSHNMKLTKKRKREIRFNGIKRLVESKESGHLFSMGDLIQAAGYKTVVAGDGQYNSGWQFITNLIKRGVLVRIDEGFNSGKYAYEVTNKSIHGRPIRDTVKKTTIELLSQRAEEPEVKIVKEEVTVTNPEPEEKEDTAQAYKTKKCYSFKITIQKQQETEHGKTLVSELEMNNVDLGQIKAMVSSVVNNFEDIV